jgi:hypothetical protein
VPLALNMKHVKKAKNRHKQVIRHYYITNKTSSLLQEGISEFLKERDLYNSSHGSDNKLTEMQVIT